MKIRVFDREAGGARTFKISYILFIDCYRSLTFIDIICRQTRDYCNYYVCLVKAKVKTQNQIKHHRDAYKIT